MPLSAKAIELLDALIGEKSSVNIPAAYAAEILELRAFLKTIQGCQA